MRKVTFLYQRNALTSVKMIWLMMTSCSWTMEKKYCVYLFVYLNKPLDKGLEDVVPDG